MAKASDYVIVGGGAAGCIIAARLSENPACRVTLIEGGDGTSHPFIKIPALAVFAMSLESRNYNFQTEPIPGMNNRQLIWAQGRGLGGGSSINGMIYLRGHSSEYDQWAQMGCKGWSFDDVLPYFKRAENNARGESQLHGGSGPMRIKPSGARLPITDAFVETMNNAGIPFREDLNCDAPDGMGYHDINVDRGRRASTFAAHLVPARARPNLTVLTNARARRLIIEKNRVVGVEILRDGKIEMVRAEREVIVSCGAVQSPQLLMLSGIGPADHLRAMGIEVVMDAPDVGQKLHQHPNFMLRYTCSKPVSAYRYLNPIRALGAGIAYMGRKGILADSCFAAGGYFRSDPDLDFSDIYVVVGTAMLRPDRAYLGRLGLLPSEHGFTMSVSLGRARSQGQIRLRSSDPADRPVIFPNYHSDPNDLRTLAKAVLRMRDMLRENPIVDLIDEELAPGPRVTDQSSMEAAIREQGGSSYHPMGTCRMGADQNSVVDSSLRVRGMEGLRIADASIIPTPLMACLHAPTIMIGEKAADLVRADA